MYGLLTWKCNPIARKRLIQVGKMLNAFFSEVDARMKEPGTLDFVEKHKVGMRKFIQKTVEETPDTKPVNIIDQKSLEQAVTEKTGQSLIQVDQQLLVYLSKSVERLEKDLEVFVTSIPSDQAAHVLSGFNKLKNELKVYDRMQNQPKSKSFLARIGILFGLGEKAKSSEDVSGFASRWTLSRKTHK